jgi:2-polyprenyl-3-methyl-5-hydroxy-6-metoxy-1,4-benzoquinol methylase
MTEFFLKSLKTEDNRFICKVADATVYDPLYTDYDFFVCAEFLEHIENPQIFLKRMLKFLKDTGKMFAVIPINHPTPDHLIHFRNLGDVENLLHGSGLSPVITKIIPSEPVTVDEAIKNKITTYYLCMCQKI